MEIICKPLGPVQANCYLIIEQGHALVIDPGDDYLELNSILRQKEAKLDAVLLTHAHFDHIAGVDALIAQFPVDVYLNPSEFEFLLNPRLNASQSFYQNVCCHAKPIALKEGMQRIGNFDVQVAFTPGHSIGSSIFQIRDCLFTGDTLFQGSVGRTDLPTGSMQQMESSISYLKTLPDSLKVYPGHGPQTMIQYEKQWNPYFRTNLY